MNTPPVPWTHDFPNAAHFVPTSRLTAHPAFKPAKRGSIAAARQVVHDLCAPQIGSVYHRLAYVIDSTRPHAIAGVLSHDIGSNQLPTAFAEAIAATYGIPVLPIHKKPSARRTKTDAISRLLHRPEFVLSETKFPRMTRVLMVDDIITTGGSISQLRQFLWAQNFWPVSAAAIAATPSRARREDGTRLAPRAATIHALVSRHPDIAHTLQAHGIYDGTLFCLTDAEAHALTAAEVPASSSVPVMQQPQP